MPSVARVGEANGRVYDPIMAQFLSPDPFIQAPGNWYNYNRYGYCWNNPLIYTDPDGEFIHLIIGALIGGTINWIANGAEFSWKGLGYFGVGAASGALGAGIGSGMMAASAGSTFGAGFIGTQGAMSAIASGYTSSFLSGAAIGGVSGFAGGFTTGFGNGLIQGQSFGDALWSGAKGGLIGGGTGALLGGLIGGLDAVGDKRNFWSGNDQGSGRSLFAFNNTDKTHTHYRHKSGYELIDNIEREGTQWINAYDERVHWGNSDGSISNGAISRRDNFMNPGNNEFTLSLDGYKGRAHVNFRGSIPEGTSVQVYFDGRLVNTYEPAMWGLNTTGQLNIPANVNSINVRYIVPNGFSPSGNISPWRTTITGFKR